MNDKKYAMVLKGNAKSCVFSFIFFFFFKEMQNHVFFHSFLFKKMQNHVVFKENVKSRDRDKNFRINAEKCSFFIVMASCGVITSI
jgi:hypothetical protein